MRSELFGVVRRSVNQACWIMWVPAIRAAEDSKRLLGKCCRMRGIHTFLSLLLISYVIQYIVCVWGGGCRLKCGSGSRWEVRGKSGALVATLVCVLVLHLLLQ